MKNNLIVLSFLILFQQTYAREVALTFDDCPRNTGTLMNGEERAQRIVGELRKADVAQVGFFCNSPKMQTDGFERIKYFANQGHLIANHSATHMDFDKTPVDVFIKEIEIADRELREFPNFRKWFRFPYLHEGKVAAKISALREYLDKSGYKNGYVTIDTQDWYMDNLLVEAVDNGKKFSREKLCTAYKELADLVAELRVHDWTIISPDLSYTDPIADREPSATVPLNQGRVFALAKEKGYKGPYWSRWNDVDEIKKEFLRRGIFSQNEK